MQESLETLDTPLETELVPTPTETASRRAFLARFAALGTGLLALQVSAHAQTAMGQMDSTGAQPMGQPMAPPMSPAMAGMAPMPGMMPAAMPTNEMQYRMAVAPVAMLSLETSRLAVTKATDPAVRQFANFELAEAIAVNNVLKDMNTPMMPMSAMDRAKIARAQATPPGADFDRDYITNQRAAHMYLRDTASNYLGAPMPRKAKMPEKHGRHLATLQLPVFIEHTTHTEEIMARMTA